MLRFEKTPEKITTQQNFRFVMKKNENVVNTKLQKVTQNVFYVKILIFVAVFFIVRPFRSS